MKKVTVLSLIIVMMGWFSTSLASEIGDGFNDVSFKPVIEYKTVDTSYTNWNKINLSGMLAFFIVGDALTTQIGLNSGCSEAHPLYGKNPSVWTIIPVKVAVMAVAWTVTEYWMEPKDRQWARNWMYGSFAVAGIGATTWNTAQILK